ncbi:MAG: hypothetical protein M3422_07335 [Actinomycetota bacterium]|nr:hypothetical protein [Actinomycetota bacterium]
MSETGETTARSPVLRALLQVGAAGGVGALVLPFGFTYFVYAAWVGGGVGTLLIGALFVAVVTGLLVAVAAVTREASRMTGTRGGRVGWALIVAGLGSVAWLVAFAVCATAEPDLNRNAMATFPFSALPYALAAGLLLRQWYAKLGAAACTVASVVGLLAVLAGTVPDEVDVRLAAANLSRGTVFVTDIPGYHRVPYQSVMEPDDPRSVPPPRYVTLYAYPDDPTGDCEPHPEDATMAGFPCTVERPGLTYTAGVTDHQYFYRKGTLLLRIVGSLAVDRDVLRDAILNARPTAKPRVHTTDINGYEALEQGSPPAMGFQPEDKALLPSAKTVEVSASTGSEAGDCAAFRNSTTPSPYLECVDERPGLYYRRLDDKHLYLARHGSMEVRVMGGLGVDRNVLRDAAVSARPATDDELMTILPPAPPPDEHSVIDRLADFAKDLLG